MTTLVVYDENGREWFRGCADQCTSFVRDYGFPTRFTISPPTAESVQRDAVLLNIARAHLLHDPNGTLDERKMDSLDFHSVGVANIKAALEAAFAAGRESVRRDRLRP